jgi:hypothetical protein
MITLTPGIEIEVSIGPAWSPLSLSNLVAYYNASLGVTQSSGNVSQWNDQSGNGNNLTLPADITTDPTYSASGFNTSYPGVTMAGGVNTSALENSSVTFGGTETFSFFLLCTIPNGSISVGIASLVANGASHDYDNTASIRLFGPGLTSNEAGWYWDNTDHRVYSFTWANTPGLWGIVSNAGSVQAYVNGAATGTAQSITSNIGSNPNLLVLGTDSTVAGDNNASVAATIAYAILTAAAMSATDISNLKAWTNANWGTSF